MILSSTVETSAWIVVVPVNRSSTVVIREPPRHRYDKFKPFKLGVNRVWIVDVAWILALV